ncbi:hypothetical protein MtrunA17_Chr2g0279111 [Medicago truncatula]|uniref:Uncharacterized protein n=1 Tax=Medicago truncatula TaxID=3880 RepID=A0A396J0V0_MEDTR|nr:hypothetical protein MtrunA17_Chr2g0279111 [Medicago truncatula]
MINCLIYLMVQPNHRYYYPQPQYPYHHHHQPYPFDGSYFDRRMVEPSHPMGAGQVGYDRYGRPYPFYDSRYSFHGRVDPYTSYQAYYETPLLPFPQPPPPASVHPFWTPCSCTIM